jgi:hypothetical protein
VLLMALCVPLWASAELYRWVERETGSVKFSNTPPPWYGDPERERNAPAVEVIQYRQPGAPASAATAEKPPAMASVIQALEARWAELNKFFAALPPGAEAERAGAGVQQQIQSYDALRAELDRLDPQGVARRRAQEPGVVETLRRGLGARGGFELQVKPPAQ